MPGRADDLLDDARGLRLLELAGGRRDHDELVDALHVLVEAERAVVDRRRQPEAVVHQRALSRSVTRGHAGDLRDRLVGLVDEADEVVREVVHERVGRRAGRAVVEDPRVVLDARGEAELLHHLDVVFRALLQAVRLEELAALVEPLEPLGQLALDLDEAPLHRLVLGDVVAGRPDRDVVDVVEDLARKRVEVVDRLDLVAEEVQAVGRLRVGGEDLHQLALGAEGAAGKRRLVAVVLHAHELLEELVAVDPLPHLEQLHLLRVELGRADAVDAGDRGDDHDVAPGEQRRRRRMAEAVDLVVDRRVLLDVEVLRRDIRLGLVVVVVGDEVLDRVLGEELAELVAELRGERLVVSDDKGRALDRLDRRGHREGLARPGRAEERQVLLARRNALGQTLDRLRLIRRRRVGGFSLKEGTH